jgi:hypothetical protein
MAQPKPYRRHLKSSDDLVTSYEAVRAGFVALALEKNRRASPFVEQARALKIAASSALVPAELTKMPQACQTKLPGTCSPETKPPPFLD